MGNKAGQMECFLDIVLILLLTGTLFQAVRLERAIGMLKRDREALQSVVGGLNASMQAAEQGIGSLHTATDGAGRLLTRHIETAKAKQDDLTFLIERADALADRLEGLIRSDRSAPPVPIGQEPEVQRQFTARSSHPRSQAEQDLMRALNLAR